MTEDTWGSVTGVTDLTGPAEQDSSIELQPHGARNPEEVTQMADKKVTPKAPQAAKSEKSEDKKPAARVSLKKLKKLKKL